MGKMETCEICGNYIDKTAVIQTRGIFSFYEETEETGMKRTRYDLCESCARRIKIEIDIKIMEEN